MQANAFFGGKIQTPKMIAQVTGVPVFIVNEDDNIIYYSPVFDLSGYGKSNEEARDSFDTALAEFFRYTTNKNTLDIELIKLGWKQQKKKSFVPPTMSELIKDRDYLSEILDSYDFEKSTFPLNAAVA